MRTIWGLCIFFVPLSFGYLGYVYAPDIFNFQVSMGVVFILKKCAASFAVYFSILVVFVLIESFFLTENQGR